MTRLLMFCFGVFIIGTLLAQFGAGLFWTQQEVDQINNIVGFHVVRTLAMGGWDVPKYGINWFQAFIVIISWDYPFLDNTFGTVFKYIFLYPITFGVVFGLIQIAIGVIQGIASSIRSLLPT